MPWKIYERICHKMTMKIICHEMTIKIELYKMIEFLKHFTSGKQNVYSRKNKYNLMILEYHPSPT